MKNCLPVFGIAGLYPERLGKISQHVQSREKRNGHEGEKINGQEGEKRNVQEGEKINGHQGEKRNRQEGEKRRGQMHTKSNLFTTIYY